MQLKMKEGVKSAAESFLTERGVGLGLNENHESPRKLSPRATSRGLQERPPKSAD